MVAAISPDWNVFKQIFVEHWDGFTHVYPRYHTRYYASLVDKMLRCGNPEQMGYIEYRCLQCGEGTHRVAMSYKSSLCLRCAQGYVDDWGSQVSHMLHEGVIYRHVSLTMPALLRPTFYRHARVLLSPFMRRGVQCLDDCFSRVSGRALKGGYIMVIQTHGRNGQYNPHLHIIATSGGWDRKASQGIHLDYVPYPMLRQTLQTKEINRLVDACDTRYREGFVTNVQKRDGPAHYQSLATSLAKYVVSPPISLRRIDCDDGQRVTYHYQSHKSERVERETVAVYTFIGRMIQHVFPKGFQRIRYYGVQATRPFGKLKILSQEALAKVRGVIKGAVKIIAPLTYRQWDQQSTGRDPLRCPHCQHEMAVWRIWHPTYGVIYDEGQVIKRGTYASTAQRASP